MWIYFSARRWGFLRPQDVGSVSDRTRAFQTAVREKLGRARRHRLAEEAAKLNPEEERALAEEGWPG